MELTYCEEKLALEIEEIEKEARRSDRCWELLALGLAATVVGMLMVVVADLLLRASC
jgi:hypothetical protein